MLPPGCTFFLNDASCNLHGVSSLENGMHITCKLRKPVSKIGLRARFAQINLHLSKIEFFFQVVTLLSRWSYLRCPAGCRPDAGQMLYSTVQYCTVLYSAVQYCTALYRRTPELLFLIFFHARAPFGTVTYCARALKKIWITEAWPAPATIEHFLARNDMILRWVGSTVNFLTDFIGFKMLKKF